MRRKAIDLFHAYTQNLLPPDGGYLVLGSGTRPADPPRYTLAHLRFLSRASLERNGLCLHAAGEVISLFPPNEPETPVRPLTAPLSVALPNDGEFAFLFPAGPGAREACRAFLTNTLAVEAGMTTEQSARIVQDSLTRLAPPEQGVP